MSRIISDEGPSEAEQQQDALLDAWCRTTVEPLEESERRRRVLEQLRDMTKQWVRYTMVTEFNLPATEDYGGRIFTTGSYRHNVHSSGSDIDVVLIAPERMTRQHFFTTLVDRLRERKGVTDLTFAEEAIVPIISFVFEGVDIDLSFCAIRMTHVPDTIDMLDNRVLIGLDEVSVRSVNGVRVAQLLIDLVPNKSVFRAALRFVKHWAKRRGVYSAKLGYPSGIGWAILVAKVCQCYPNQNGAGVVARFFRFYRSWFKPNAHGGQPNSAVFLTPSLIPPNPIAGVPKCWDPKGSVRDAQALFPVITPAYPYQNACYNVSRMTLATLCEEFAKGHELVTRMFDSCAPEAPRLAAVAAAAVDKAAAAAAGSPGGKAGDAAAAAPELGPEPYGLWSHLQKPYEFFTCFNYYLHVTVSSTAVSDYDRWVDFVEAKMRFLWTESGQNRGAAFECYPQVKIRVFSGRFEDPKQVDEMQRIKAFEKAKTQRNMSLSASPGGDHTSVARSAAAAAALKNASPIGGLAAASPDARGLASPLVGAAPSASPKRDAGAGLYSAHFYFGLTMNAEGDNAAGAASPKAAQQKPAQPNLPEIVRAWQNIVREKMTSNTKLPTVEIQRARDLPTWLPGRAPAAPVTAAPGADAAAGEKRERDAVAADAQRKPVQPTVTSPGGRAVDRAPLSPGTPGGRTAVALNFASGGKAETNGAAPSPKLPTAPAFLALPTAGAATSAAVPQAKTAAPLPPPAEPEPSSDELLGFDF